MICGPWVGFRAEGRASLAQPDIVLPMKDRTIVLEIKHSEMDAWEQVEKYKVLLERLRDVPSVGVMVCRRVVSEPDWLGEDAEITQAQADGLWLLWI